jgi:hypothetical protein
VTPGQVLTPAQLQQLFVSTTGNFTGTNFIYSATDNSGATSPANATVALITATLNLPPVANNANSSLPPNSSRLLTGLGGSDTDGSIASYTINTLPPADQAVLYLGDPANGGVAVTPGQVLTPAQLEQLFVSTTGNFTGTNFTYSATDNSGATSPANATFVAAQVTPTPTPTPTPGSNEPPVANNANSSLPPNSSKPVTGLGGSDPDGSIASYTIEHPAPSRPSSPVFRRSRQRWRCGDTRSSPDSGTVGATICIRRRATLQEPISPTALQITAAPPVPLTATVGVILPSSNEPPVANNANSRQTPNSSRLLTGLGGSDPDGTIASYTINTLPPADQAVLYLGDPANGGVAVTPGQVLTPAQLQQLFLFTTGNFTGTTFTYSATDNGGAISPAPATVAAVSQQATPTPTPGPVPTPTPGPTANTNSRTGANSDTRTNCQHSTNRQLPTMLTPACPPTAAG